MPLAELAAPAAALARDGFEVNPEQAFFLEILAPILTHFEEAAAIYAPEGRILGSGRPLRLPASSATHSSASAARAPSPSTGARSRARSRTGCRERGGTLGTDDLAAYEPIARAPVEVAFQGRPRPTNPPPSSGGS